MLVLTKHKEQSKKYKVGIPCGDEFSGRFRVEIRE
jgi:hypothetical protein